MSKSILAAVALTLACSGTPTRAVAEVRLAVVPGCPLHQSRALDLYRRYVKGLASLAGASDREADRVASSVIAIETALVRAAIDEVSPGGPDASCPLARARALARRTPCSSHGVNFAFE